MRPGDLKKKIRSQNANIERVFDTDLAYHVAVRIQEARDAQNLTQAELAARIGTSQSNIARAEKGDTLPSLAFLKRLAEKGFGSHLVPPAFAFMEPAKGTRADSSSSNDVRVAVIVGSKEYLSRPTASHTQLNAREASSDIPEKQYIL